MTPETETDMAQGIYCKAGFQHATAGDCEHVVAQQGPIKQTFKLPSDFYSEEATARRREENRRKYQPIHRPYHQDRVLVGNEAKEGIYG